MRDPFSPRVRAHIIGEVATRGSWQGSRAGFQMSIRKLPPKVMRTSFSVCLCLRSTPDPTTPPHITGAIAARICIFRRWFERRFDTIFAAVEYLRTEVIQQTAVRERRVRTS